LSAGCGCWRSGVDCRDYPTGPHFASLSRASIASCKPCSRTKARTSTIPPKNSLVQFGAGVGTIVTLRHFLHEPEDQAMAMTEAIPSTRRRVRSNTDAEINHRIDRQIERTCFISQNTAVRFPRASRNSTANGTSSGPSKRMPPRSHWLDPFPPHAARARRCFSR
jgi:hypothetical protein